MPLTKQYENEHLIEDLQSVYYNYGEATKRVIDKCDDMASYSLYRERFGSLSEARERANVDKYKCRQGESEEKVKELIRESERSQNHITAKTASKELSRAVSRSGKPLSELRDEAGVLRDHSKSKSTFNRSKIEMIEELRTLNSPVADDDIRDETSYTINEYRYTFGTTTRAKEIAGVKSGLCKSQFSELWNNLTGASTVEEALNLVDGYDEDANYYVYRLRFENDHFYIGATNSIHRRMSEKEYWPKNNPQEIHVESFEDKERCEERETELTFETAIEFDTNNVYGGHLPYSPEV